MQEGSILKISLSISLLGLLLLYFFSHSIEIPEQRIDTLKDGLVKIRGRVDQVKDSGKTANIRLIQECSLDILLFKSQDIVIYAGDYAEIEGEYKDGELIAHEVVVLGRG